MKKQILLAVSGGMDSMVMLHYMIGLQGVGGLAVAHCNFQLRGEESEGDEQFVASVCERYGVEFFSTRFDTLTHARERGMGTQEAARALRYSWFFTLKNEFDFESIATAHHTDDSIESFFINLLRGSGPQGLSGIQEDSERGIIRPLKAWSRHEVLDYAERHELEWREDSSNSSNKYLRNQIRHQLIPLLRDMRPGFDEVLLRNMSIQKEMAEWLNEQANEYRHAHVSGYGEDLRIELERTKHLGLILYTLLSEYGFNRSQVEAVLKAEQSGKQILSGTHVITTHDGGLLLGQCSEVPFGEWTIEEDLFTGHLPIHMEVIILDKAPDWMNPGPNVAYLDRGKLQFPLRLRNWREGDRFTPLGMHGTKKVSDFLVDIKLPREQKKSVMVIESGQRIVWLVGLRISEEFKVDKNSGSVLMISLEPERTDI